MWPADACPVTRIVEQIAKKNNIECILLCDTNQNIDKLLMERHLAKKARMGKGKHHLKGPSKRTEENDKNFLESFEKLIAMAVERDKVD